ncbi:MAG: flippase-like domain-containing protein [Candidatus Zixiibacteriota bacterium]|nr:MAG: flippase-like domain-containing protein [candidate division Zixibacteria bacterium]
MNVRKTLLTTLKAVLTLAVLYFVGRQVVVHWADVERFDWRIQPFPLFLSVSFGLVAFYIFSACWRAVIGGFGHRVSIAKSFKISYLSNLGRYIPGKVWQVFGMVYLTGREGIAAEQAVASFAITQIFAVPAAMLVYIVAAQFDSRILIDRIAMAGEGTAYMLTGLMVLFSVILVLKPGPFVWLANRILKMTGRPPAVFALDKKVALLVFAGYVLGWICYGMAFWFFLVSIIGCQTANPVAAVGLFNGAYQVGYLALFAPGGLGPRELVLGKLLEPFTLGLSAMLAVMARLWAILIEGIAAVIALSLRK